MPAVLVAFVGTGATSAFAATGQSGQHGKSAAAKHAPDHSSGTAGTSGDPTKPQPPSKADQNSGGANGQCPGGPYCSTRDGSPSKNGNGGGQAKGKPCAGCVGKADNKNPKGQNPNGSDHNNGYECDGNNGVGKTNPAHTGCQSSPPPPPTCEDTHSCPPPPCEQTNTCQPPPCEQTNTCQPPPCDTATQDCTNPPPCDEATEDCTNPPPCDEATEDCTNPPTECTGGTMPGSETNCVPGTCVNDESTAAGTCVPEQSGCVPAAENNFCTTVLGEHQERPTASVPAVPTTVLGERVVRGPTGAGVLPFTGAAGLTWFAASGGLLLGVGGLLTALGRRRRTA